MIDKTNKIWLGVAVKGALRVLGAGVIFVGSLAWVSAQSSSTSYKAVDFLNPEANLSSSGSYKLSDSVGPYGGVNHSTGYTECTGDFATLSACEAIIIPPTPPTPPPIPPTSPVVPPSGAGGDHPAHQDCNTVDCLNNPPVVPPIVPPVVVEPVKKPFKLPVINEPVAPVVGNVPGTNPVTAPVTVGLTPQQIAAVINPPGVNPAAGQAGQPVQPEVLKSAASVLCEDLACSEVSLRPSAAAGLNQLAAGLACQLYLFGGYQFNMNCSDVSLVFVAIGLGVLGLSGIVFHPAARLVETAVLTRAAGLKRKRKSRRK